MLKYIQTQVPVPLFRRLKIEALEQNTTLNELLQEILTTWEANLNKEEENGEKEIIERPVRSRES